MDPREVDALVQRLIANPHDQEVLAYAHQAGASDPRSYATLLERVGRETPDPAYASHWLSEAANVWSTTLGDVHHAAEVLLLAVVKDPTQDVAAQRLAQLYREKGDVKGLVALLEKRAKLLAPLVAQTPELSVKLAAMHEELGTLWADPPLSQPARALENFKRAYETDPQSVFSIYSARELLKQMQQYAEAVPLFALEQAVITDAERKLVLYRDEADVRRLASDLPGVTAALRNMRSYSPEDPALIQEQASSVLERIQGGEAVGVEEREEAAALFVSLSEIYQGAPDYALSYATAALEIVPGHDRAVQLASFYAAQLERDAELIPLWNKYVEANPSGVMVEEVRAKLASTEAAAEAPLSQPEPTSVSSSDLMDAEPASMPEVAPVQPAAEEQPPVAQETPAPVQEAPAQVAPEPAPVEPVQAAAEPVVEAPAPVAVEPAPVAAEPVQEPALVSSPVPSAPAISSPLPIPSQPPMGEMPASREQISQMLESASQLAMKRQNKEALAKYMEVLSVDPVSPEALAWVDEHLRSRRKFSELRDVYQAAARAQNIPSEMRKKYLSNVANICEQQLRDLDGAIQALKQASQIDGSVRDNLRRLLEKGQRWDDLAVLLDQEVMEAPDQEIQIVLLKKLAALHEQKRKDVIAAGEAWARLATILLGDESPIQSAVKLFEKGGRLDLAADVIAENSGAVDSNEARSPLVFKLGELREKSGNLPGAGDSYAEAAELGEGQPAWEAAERCFQGCERWDEAARAAGQLAELAPSPIEQAALRAREADYLLRGGDMGAAIGALELAGELDPLNDSYAEILERQYQQESRTDDLVVFLLKRASKLLEASQRVTLRKRVAEMQRTTLSDADGARETLLSVLDDGDDAEALQLLAEDARNRADFQEEVTFLHRLAAITEEPAAKIAIQLREASTLAQDLNDTEGAIAAYQSVLDSLDAKNQEALQAIADLEERRDNPKGAAAALEKLLALVESTEQKLEISRRLAPLYENLLSDPRGAIRALEVVHSLDPDDLEAVTRLIELCESVEEWTRMAELLGSLIEVEGDPEEASVLARRLSAILDERLGRGQEAMAVLEPLADEADEACREAYIALGDKLTFKGIVAMKMCEWYSLAPAAQQHEAFRGAFERFLEMGREADAARTAVELIQSKGATPEIIKRLEEIATKLRDLESLSIAHTVMVREFAGAERAQEFVRQAEVLVQAGVEPIEAIQHGEQGLASVPAAEAEPLLARLAQLAPTPAHVVDLYERQVGRCRNPSDRLEALARAAQVAAERGALDRAQALFELALGGGVREEALEVLERAAIDGDAQLGSTELRKALAQSMATGNHGLRDGGRTRSALLRRAAMLSHRELGDTDKAFEWLGEALVSHVEPATLDLLEQLGDEIGDLRRVEQVIGRALEQVFDGPLVRQLVGRRAALRRQRLNDSQGAAEDLRRLHDLSPADKSITDDLFSLLTELRDYRGMVQLLEDQILRGKDPAVRAELARKAARIWEERLADPREAADAWRRVLRMKPGDPEAQAGLERAKSDMLKKPASQLPPAPEVPVAMPPMPPEIPVPAEAQAPAVEAPVAEEPPPATVEAPVASEPEAQEPAEEPQAAEAPAKDEQESQPEPMSAAPATEVEPLLTGTVSMDIPAEMLQASVPTMPEAETVAMEPEAEDPSFGLKTQELPAVTEAHPSEVPPTEPSQEQAPEQSEPEAVAAPVEDIRATDPGVQMPPQAEESQQESDEEKPVRPDITFGAETPEDEPTLSAPVTVATALLNEERAKKTTAPPPLPTPAPAEESPALELTPVANVASAEMMFVGEDEVEAIEEVESVSDDDLVEYEPVRSAPPPLPPSSMAPPPPLPEKKA